MPGPRPARVAVRRGYRPVPVPVPVPRQHQVQVQVQVQVQAQAQAQVRRGRPAQGRQARPG